MVARRLIVSISDIINATHRQHSLACCLQSQSHNGTNTGTAEEREMA